MRSRPRKVESPIVDRAFQRRDTTKTSKKSFSWGTVNLLLAVFFYFESCYQPVSRYYSFKSPIFQYAVSALAIVFTLSTLVDFVRYLINVLSGSVVELTPRQRVLLGVKDSEPGFKTVTPIRQMPSNSASPSVISPTTYSTYAGGTYATSFGTPSSGSPSPYHGNSPGSSPHFNISGHMQGTSFGMGGSGSYIGGQLINQSGNASFNQTNSPVTPHLSTLFQETPEYQSPKSRFSNSARNISLSAVDTITDQAALDKYLKEQYEKEYKQHLASPENSPSAANSFWSYSKTATDFTPVLSKYQYQIACRSPQSTKASHDDPDDPSTFRASEVWIRLGVLPTQVDKWIENLRKWFGQTIVSRVAREIEKVNARLDSLGSGDMQIGEITVASLKQLAVTKGQHVPALNHVIPFLECSANQEYLVQRIKELGSTGCMSDFNWRGGARYRGKPWGEHLPTDSIIVMHLLCTYMDARLPPHPKYPDGKTFTSEHFMKTPEKPNLKKVENLILYQSKMNPPHFKVVIGEEICDFSKGRNNMFQCILLFLNHVKTTGGMLNRVNLGLSGINVLWVLDDES